MTDKDKQHIANMAQTNPEGLVRNDEMFRLWIMDQIILINSTVQDPTTCPIGKTVIVYSRLITWGVGVAIALFGIIFSLLWRYHGENGVQRESETGVPVSYAEGLDGRS